MEIELTTNPSKIEVSLTSNQVEVSLQSPMQIEVSSTPSLISLSVTPAILELGTFNVSQATTSVQGKVELATSAEAVAGTDTERAVTPAGLAAALAGVGTGAALNITTVNEATYTLLAADIANAVNILNITYTDTGTVTITIPSALIAAGEWTLLIKDADLNAATNNITIQTEGAEKIDEAATLTININGAAVNLFCDGSNLFIY